MSFSYTPEQVAAMGNTAGITIAIAVFVLAAILGCLLEGKLNFWKW